MKNKILCTHELGTNYNGYPLENVEFDDISNKIVTALESNTLTRFHKNIEYELVLKVQPKETGEYSYDEELELKVKVKEYERLHADLKSIIFKDETVTVNPSLCDLISYVRHDYNFKIKDSKDIV